MSFGLYFISKLTRNIKVILFQTNLKLIKIISFSCNKIGSDLKK